MIEKEISRYGKVLWLASFFAFRKSSDVSAQAAEQVKLDMIDFRKIFARSPQGNEKILNGIFRQGRIDEELLSIGIELTVMTFEQPSECCSISRPKLVPDLSIA